MKSASSRERDRGDFSQPKFNEESYSEVGETSLGVVLLDDDDELKELSFGEPD